MRRLALIMMCGYLLLAYSAQAEDSESAKGEESTATITAADAKQLLIESPSIVTDKDRGFATAVSLYGEKLPEFLRQSLQVKEHPVQGLPEALGIQVFGFELPGHCEDLIVTHHRKVESLDFFGSSHVSQAILIGEALYVTRDTPHSKSYLKVTIDEDAKLQVERHLIGKQPSWNERHGRESAGAKKKRIESTKAVEQVFALVEEELKKTEDPK